MVRIADGHQGAGVTGAKIWQRELSTLARDHTYNLSVSVGRRNGYALTSYRVSLVAGNPSGFQGTDWTYLATYTTTSSLPASGQWLAAPVKISGNANSQGRKSCANQADQV